MQPRKNVSLAGDQVFIPAAEIPSYRTTKALEMGTENDWLVTITGGLGDRICAEPTLRYILNNMPDIRLSIQTDTPELFSHLDFYRVFAGNETIATSKYYHCQNVYPDKSLAWEFYSHAITHPVDYTSLAILRMQLPVAYRQIQLPMLMAESDLAHEASLYHNETIIVHPGKHWPSKTLPKDYWQQVIDDLKHDFRVVLVGKKIDDNVGYVDVSGKDTLDLRDRLSLNDFLYVVFNASFVLTNDSAPIHIASAKASTAHIGFFAGPKHPDYLYHWRYGYFGWRMSDLSLDGYYNHVSVNPISKNKVTIDDMDQRLWDSFLPAPKDVVSWFKEKRSRPENDWP
jgi:hypothetical protein